MRYASPLRYPGGKGCLAEFLRRFIERNGLRDCAYYEAYAGGAGAALKLLHEGVVSRIHINDADQRVNAFWRAAVHESARFVERIFDVPLDLVEWRRQHAICAQPEKHADFDVGFSAFYMNRCNRSGILTNAGPIGGYTQSGRWRLGVRFYRESLAERILLLGRSRKHIQITNLDAIEFLKSKLPRGRGRGRVCVYLDPPYVHKGQRLYLNAYEERDHVQLARYLERQLSLPWIMSYDDTPLVRGLYANRQLRALPIQYTLHEKRLAQELIIAPHHVDLPAMDGSSLQKSLFECPN